MRAKLTKFEFEASTKDALSLERAGVRGGASLGTPNWRLLTAKHKRIRIRRLEILIDRWRAANLANELDAFSESRNRKLWRILLLVGRRAANLMSARCLRDKQKLDCGSRPKKVVI